MDFDLFELEDDIGLASLQFVDTEREISIDSIPEFQCSGEDSLRSKFSTEGFIMNAFLSHCGPAPGCRIGRELTLTAYEFQAEHLHDRSVARFVFGEACMNIQYMMASIHGLVSGDHTDNRSHYQRRQQVTHLYHLLLQTTHAEQWPLLGAHLDIVRRLINVLTERDAWRTFYHANSSKGNECTTPAYHFLHGALEWKLLDLCLLHRYNTTESPVSAFLVQLERVFDDLLTCSLHVYAKKCSAALPQSSPFPCSCFKELWLLLQLALPMWAAGAGLQELSFWTLFNKAMARKRTQLGYFALTELTFAEFANWLLYAVARLYGYRADGTFAGSSGARVASSATAENHDFAKQCAQTLLQAHPSEEQLRIFICLATPTLLEWWQPRVHIPLLLWEHLHKRLNTPFYAAGAALSQLAITCGSGHAYLGRYRALLADQPAAPDANLSSYTLFTVLLGKTLERLRCAQATNPAQQLLGRIYTKFSESKLLALNETGVHHLVELLLVLALCGDFATLAPKLRDKLLAIALDKVSAARQLAVAKGHMALLELHVERRMDIVEYVRKLLQQLRDVRGGGGPHQIIADAVLDVFAHSDDFQLGEPLLIDAWLPNHLSSCTAVEQDRSLEALHRVLEKLQCGELDAVAHDSLLRRLNSHILPFVKQQYATGHSVWLPQLAADFCCVADAVSTRQLMTFFIEEAALTAANVQALPQFVLKMLESQRAASVDPTTVIRVWLRSLVMLTASNEAVTQLTQHVIALPTFGQMTGLSGETLLAAKEPLCVFVAAVGKCYDACADDYERRRELAELFNVIVRHFEQWLPADPKFERTEALFRFYSFVAIVIFNCPHIAYVKSRITCFLHVAMTRFILPTSVQMGKPPEPRQAQLVHKVWPVIVQGVGRLSFRTDPYVGKTLTDLVVKWTPHFNVSPSAKLVARPFVSCLQADADDDQLSLFVLEKMAAHFLPGQQNPNAALVLSICQEVVAAATTPPCDAINERRLETIVQAIGLHMLEHFMMVTSSRSLVLGVLRRLVDSAPFRSSRRAKDLLAESLRVMARKHLALSTSLYFELLGEIAENSYEVVESVWDFVVAEVLQGEQRRPAGENSRVNASLEQLRQHVNGVKTKRQKILRTS